MPPTRAGRNFLTAGTIAAPGTIYFDYLHGHLGVGNNAGAFVDTQTDLLGATTVGGLSARKQMDLGFPAMYGANAYLARSTLLAGEGIMTIAEWGWFNAAIGGTMLTRKPEALGTKTLGPVWTLTAAFTYLIC